MPPELSRAPESDGPPGLSGPADLETRLAERPRRARATRAVGGTLSPRAARDLRARLVDARSAALGDRTAARRPRLSPSPPRRMVASAPASGGRRAAIRVERRRWAREAQSAPEVAPVPLPSPSHPPPAQPHTGAGEPGGRSAASPPCSWSSPDHRRHRVRLRPPAHAGRPQRIVVEASGATAARLGAPIQLAAGTALQAGDTVTVSSQGSAVLGLGDSRCPPRRRFRGPPRSRRCRGYHRGAARRARLLPRCLGHARPVPRHDGPGDLDGHRHGLRHRP